MAQLVALLQSDPALLPCQLRRLSPAVDLQAVPGKALGVGYVDNGRVLLRKRPAPPQGASLEQLAHDVRSQALLATAHRLSGNAFREEDTAPYRFRGWMFGGTGRILPMGERAAVLAELPDFLQRGLIGPSDAELAFFTTLGRIYAETRTLEAPDLPPELAARALADSLKRLDERALTSGVPLVQTTALLSNGRMLVALRRGRPLSFALLEGLSECEPCGVERTTDEKHPRVRPHRTLKAVALATKQAPHGGVQWIEIPDNHLVIVSRSLEVKLTPLG
jgi:glutamine amidotransferase